MNYTVTSHVNLKKTLELSAFIQWAGSIKYGPMMNEGSWQHQVIDRGSASPSKEIKNVHWLKIWPHFLSDKHLHLWLNFAYNLYFPLSVSFPIQVASLDGPHNTIISAKQPVKIKKHWTPILSEYKTPHEYAPFPQCLRDPPTFRSLNRYPMIYISN